MRRRRPVLLAVLWTFPPRPRRVGSTHQTRTIVPRYHHECTSNKPLHIIYLGPRVHRAGRNRVPAAPPHRTAMAPRILYYNDSRHPLIYMYEPPITRRQWEQCVDELLGTPVDCLVFNLGTGQGMLHDTQGSGEIWGENVEDGTHPSTGAGEWTHVIFRRAHQNMAHLLESGLDPLAVVAERCHEHGLLLYPSLMMSDNADDGDVRCSTWVSRVHCLPPLPAAMATHPELCACSGSPTATSRSAQAPSRYLTATPTSRPAASTLSTRRCEKSGSRSCWTSSNGTPSTALSSTSAPAPTRTSQLTSSTRATWRRGDRC